MYIPRGTFLYHTRGSDNFYQFSVLLQSDLAKFPGGGGARGYFSGGYVPPGTPNLVPRSKKNFS